MREDLHNQRLQSSGLDRSGCITLIVLAVAFTFSFYFWKPAAQPPSPAYITAAPTATFAPPTSSPVVVATATKVVVLPPTIPPPPPPPTVDVFAPVRMTGEQGVVTTSALNIRSAANGDSATISWLKQCDVVSILGREGDWLKIRRTTITGYVLAQYIGPEGVPCSPGALSAPGFANANPGGGSQAEPPSVVERYRTGATCVDAWVSSATGKGACSWHGGVACWLYSDGTCTKP